MIDNDRLEEQAMDSNRNRMKGLNKLFSIAFYICAPYPAISLVIDIIAVGVALISFGHYAVSPLGLILKLLAHIAMFGSFLWSYLKDKNGTIAAIAVAALWFIFNLVTGSIDIIVLGLSIVWIAAQVLCLIKYTELEFLKAQPGYPDFNSIFFHKTNNRRVTDEQIRESFKENKITKNNFADKTYPVPAETVMKDDGSGFMEILNADASMLDDNNAAGYENHFMEDISADNITYPEKSHDD
ncbi:MAG: hypothetical protein J1E40_13365 [Oscillospiraceae bacterium]|nr:hypothetical protein [Oscillospiraceae bacterium]